MARPSENTMDNSSTSTSSSEDSDHQKVEYFKEPDPTKIPFHFLKKGGTCFT